MGSPGCHSLQHSLCFPDTEANVSFPLCNLSCGFNATYMTPGSLEVSEENTFNCNPGELGFDLLCDLKQIPPPLCASVASYMN